MDPQERILRLVEDAIAPEKMSLEESKEFLEELAGDIEARLLGVRTDLGDFD